jgi:hypothetical protein
MNRLLVCLLSLLSLLTLLVVVLGITAAWNAFWAIPSGLAKALLVVAVLVAVPLLGWFFKRAYLAFLDVQFVKEELATWQDARRRANEEHETTLYLLRTRLPANTEGNRDFIYDERSGQVTEVAGGNYIESVPHTYAPHLSYSYRDTSTRVQEEDEHPVLGPGSMAHPSMESLLALLPDNALQVCLGVSVATGKPFLLDLRKGTHYRIIGGSGFGKSCQAGAILEMSTRTNDPDLLQVALLDLEHKTSRLFEHLPHIAELTVGHRRVPLVATSPDEVAEHFRHLRRELDRRKALSEYDLARERFLFIYVEEFLSLKREVDPDLKTKMLDDFSILALRGRKYGLYLLACAQVDYSDKQLREAMNQFTVNMSFAVRPRAAQAAGFVNYELLQQNFQAKQPGQFVLETTGCSDLMLAPDFDVQARLRALERATWGGIPDRSLTVPSPFLPTPMRLVEAPRTSLERGENEDENDEERPVQADRAELTEHVLRLRQLGWGKEAIIKKVFGVSKGGSKRYREAEALYELLLQEDADEDNADGAESEG